MSQFLKWAAEMDRAASVAEAESDGSPQFLAIIDGNRAIAEVLRQGAALEAAIAHAAAQFDVADAKRADDAPCSAESHFREAVRTIARTLPPSTAKVDRAAIWGELREMDRLHTDNAKLAADLAAAEAAINALDCHPGATEGLGHDCNDASPCMREVLESARDAALADLAETKATLDEATNLIAWLDREWPNQIAAALHSTADKLGRTPSMMAGHVRSERDAHTETWKTRAEIKAKLAAAEIERDSWKRAHAECSRRLASASVDRDQWKHRADTYGDDLNRIRAMCTPAEQEPDIESTPDCVRRNLVALRKEADATKAKLAEALEKRDGAFALVSMADNERKIAEGQLAALSEIHPFHHWGDDDGPVLWFCLPVSEQPFHVGTPDDSDWPWGANDMADAEFTSQIGWSRLPRVNKNIASRGPTDSLPSPEAPSPSDGMRGSREHRSGRDSLPTCGHSACSQHHIDTGSAECVEGDDGN